MLWVQGATHLRLLVLLVCNGILLLKASEIVVLRCTRLERTPKEQLRGEQWSKVHIKTRGRGSVIAWVVARVELGSGIYRHIVASGVALRVTSGPLLVHIVCPV